MPVVCATQQAILEASQLLKRGGVVGFPTETVYGLGCDTMNREAIQQIYTMKNRPENNPLIAHVIDSSWAKEITCGWDERCDRLANLFWPGPLTIVLPRANNVPKEASGGHDTIAVRHPKHNVAEALLNKFGGPISAPSANKSGYTSPTSAKHVCDDFGNELFILDGGDCNQGIESTVLSMVESPVILRLGSVDIAAMKEVLGDVRISLSHTQTQSPGSANRHYSPKTKLIVQTRSEIEKGKNEKAVYLTIASCPTSAMKIINMPMDAPSYARRLYGALREADSIEATTICVEQPPTDSEWDAINDRLKRASSN